MNQSKTKHISTPCYILEEEALLRNLEILDSVQKQTGSRIIMALKGFAMFAVFPLIRKYLYGVSASSVDEARLGYEEFGKEVHVCSPAYSDDEFNEILNYADYIVFNSFSQWKRFKKAVATSKKKIMCGIRINPEHSEVKVSIYDPCGQFSRLGTTRNNFDENELDGITGLHFHNLCELNSDSLLRTLKVVEEKFGVFFNRLKWINFGGGHHITRKDYDINLLCNLINDFKKRYPLEVYLEPGEAIALNAGVLEASVIDIIHNEMEIAILDTSAATHMPDVLEMPYRPNIRGAGLSGEYKYSYRLGGSTCLAGDIIGDYSFPKPLEVGSRVVFEDMAHYTMVKNNTFNGIRLPSIAIRKKTGDIKLIKKFGYEDYKNRLS
ncbi:MAG: carboxynorspermidine decarboxylase [Pseudomonadota bacterium]